ncbi:MAG: hypothetical protein H8E35_16010 [Ardenticatenia bacterium]|nr:hypothetical protein [Ardenticatenia bacterium]
MTRLWRKGQQVEVELDGSGVPRAFEWNGRVHRIVSISKRWRVHNGWWRTEVWREYFKLETDTGLLVIIYRDLLTDEWYFQRLYD